MAAATLRVRLADHEATLEPGQVVTVGRHRASMLRSSHERVSRFHAVVRGEADRWVFEDVGSMNGSFLDAERITRLEIDRSIAIRLGDRRTGPILELHVG